ncbi:N-acetylmuramoyl-L-alanine amidase [Paenibacillus sp. R14(2021)]|uniref:N-acetylmuramoyl-L-alanine amidase n=1 Tax=Paenibacillus sp. R14(2021) TaxID=2859228 RepID=UPI001C616019|nr:N-acetylmuramoyl-L-alanine amidase [Paenibacillus sp. R14(2021)]
MKKFVTVVFLLSLLISMFPGIAGAAEAPKLYLNGKQLASNAEPKIVGASTLVPIRTITEGLGYDVNWTSPNVTISNGDTNVILTIGGKTAVVNDHEVKLEAPALNNDGATLVPLRFVGEQFGLDVYWDADTRTVHMYQQNVSNPPVTEPGDGGNPAPPVDGGTDPGTGTPGNGDGGTTTPAGDETAFLKSIVFDGLGSIYLPYTGEIGDVKQQVLHSPERVVVDLPYMNFAADFSTGFTETSNGGKLGEVVVDSHPTLKKIRYSYFSDKPSTVRVVLDLNAPTNYQVSKEDHVIRIDVLEQTGPVTTDPGTPVDPPTGKDVFNVVLDAGHGAKDPGALSINGHQEKEYNLAITLKVKALLDKESRIKPYLTRSNDTFVELDDRAKFANDLHANLFVSFHANKTENATVSGSETYYYRSDSIPFAKVMHKHLVAGTGFRDRGVRQAAYVVVKKTTMPAVLLEAGYLSNASDSSVLFSDVKQNKIAAEIVAGIKEYLKLS